MTNSWDDFLEGVEGIDAEMQLPTCTFIGASELNNKTGDKLLGLNIRGLKSNNSSLAEFFDGLNKPQEIKVLVLTEIFNADSAEKDNYISSHNFISTIRKERSPNHGGIGFLIEKGLSYKAVQVENMFIEGLIESMVIIVPEIKAIILGIYRPNACPNSNTALFVQKLKEIMNSISKLPEYKKYTTYIMGDLNIDLRHPDDPTTATFIDNMIESMFLPANTHCSTRISQHSSSIIDHTWSNNIGNIAQSFVCEDIYISDHLINGISLKTASKDEYETIRSRKITEQAKTTIKEKLVSTDWSNVLLENENNKKWENLTENITKVLDEVCPITEKRVKVNRGPPRSPWMTEGLKQSQYTQMRLFKLANRDPNGPSGDAGKTNLTKFKEYRRIHSKTRRQAKRSYFNSKFKEIKHNAKETWNVLNSLIRNKSTKSKKVDELEVDGKKITSNKEISNEFNKFYASVGETQAATIPNTEKDPRSFLTGSYRDSMFFFPTTTEEVTEVCKTLAKKPSKGKDGIPTNILLNSITELGDILANCINSSFEQGSFPQCLKGATVIPLHKKNSKKDPSNYRPVSLLNSLSKIIEKVIHARLYEYMKDKICKNQFGFRPKHSTTDLMIMTIEGIVRNLDSEGFVIPCFFDLGKAFDTLPHKGILDKLEHYGVRGVAKDLFASYLANRSQECLVNGCLSDSTLLTIGVPQGSILGPLLFIIYINDIQKSSPETLLGMYADDTSMIIPGKTLTEAVTKTKETLSTLGEWFASNKLSLSPAKCKYAVMSRKLQTQAHPTTFEIYNKNMKEIRTNTDSCNNPLVGLLITEKLSYEDQIHSMLGKLRKGLYALRANKALPPFAKKNIYFATIHSHLGYAGIMLGCAPKGLIGKIRNIQNKALRILVDARYNENADPIYKKLKILKVEDIYAYQACVYGWRYFKGDLPEAIANLIETCNARSMMLKTGNFNLKTLSNLSPIEFIKENWNRLPIGIKKTAKFVEFKTQLRNLIMANY